MQASKKAEQFSENKVWWFEINHIPLHSLSERGKGKSSLSDWC